MSCQILIILYNVISHENLSASHGIVMEKVGSGAEILNFILSFLGDDVKRKDPPEFDSRIWGSLTIFIQF